MAIKTNDVIRQLRKIVLFQGEGGLTDGQLMDEYLGRREEAALSALIRRHGPMVWGVCRRMLHKHHDIEDAFQSTFLVLVRKAASIKPREMVGNWIHGVAVQTAKNAKAAAVRRERKEGPMIDMPQTEQEARNDLLPFLDQELLRLPGKYRTVLVMCDLEGKTRKEAARQLRVPEGTVAGHLVRARTMLAKRLSRHGAEVSGGALAAILSQTCSANVPFGVMTSTINAAASVAAGNVISTVVSVSVLALTEGVVRTMFLKKLQSITAVLLVLLLAGSYGGGQLLTHSTAAAQPQVGPTSNGTPDLQPAIGQAPPRLMLPSKLSTIPEQAVVTITDAQLVVQTKAIESMLPKTENGRTTYHAVERLVTMPYNLEEIKAYDMKGKELTSKDLLRRLDKATLALVAKDGRDIDPLQLRLYRDDTLLFRLPVPILPAQPAFPVQPGNLPLGNVLRPAAPSTPVLPPPVIQPRP